MIDNKLTTRELAIELKRAPETIIRWRRLRVGPPFLRIQGRVLYERAAVEKWLVEGASIEPLKRGSSRAPLSRPAVRVVTDALRSIANASAGTNYQDLQQIARAAIIAAGLADELT